MIELIRKSLFNHIYKDGSEALARLNDYGCLHFKTGVILGVSEPRYSKEELDRIHKETTEPIEYDGRTKTLYEWKQTQRKFEREIRKESQIRDMAKETGNNILAKDCNFKINTYRAKYDDMCKKIGLEPKYERMRTYTAGSLTKNGSGGIIKLGSEPMYRKTKENQIEPMPKKQLHKIEKNFKKQGRLIQRSSEIDEYLESKHAEAITYNANTILLKSNPGRASVFEELIHATQYKNGENDGSYVSRLQCEISAQKKLIKYKNAYKLTEKEVEQTKQALEVYERELNEFLRGGK